MNNTGDIAAHRPRVLIVDDDPDLRMLAEMQLAPTFEVFQAGGGEECVSVAVAESPDVILLDMMMPGMNGEQVLDKLAGDPATRDIPVIFLTSLSSTDDRVNGIDKGAVDYITKPTEPREFVARVGAAARTRARYQVAETESRIDHLTKLADRKAFEARLTQEAARARRMATPLAVLLIDIDKMDTFNEARGRDAGDALLVQIGEALTKTLRTSDTVFRYGGDEFAALLTDSDAGAAYLAAERCRDAIHQIPGGHGVLSVSIGVAELSAGRTLEELIAKGEIALFRAKESGGDRSWRADDPRRHGLNPIALAEGLTEREWSILVHLADKRTEHEIADHMGIRPGTVRSHKARIRRKLHVSPDVRLSEFVRDNFRDLVERIPIPPSGDRTPVS